MPIRPFAKLICVVAVTFAGACAPATPPKSEASLLLGERMPPFQTETMSGRHVVSAGFQGQAAVLVFVTTDCEACNRALLAAQTAFDEYGEIHVVSIFQREGAEKARSLAAKLKLAYPAAIDLDGTIGRQFRVQDVPRTFVIDADGLIRWIGGAHMTEADLLAAVEAFPRR
jgi:cytochrome c biogenesis protein CcmG, thiol:disulfide interchange protein DsbE